MSALSLFDHINNLQANRDPKEDDYKNYSPYMAMRFFSMNVRNLETCAALSRYTFLDIGAKRHYSILRDVPMQRPGKYIKNKSEKMSELVGYLERYWPDTALKQEELQKMIDEKFLCESDLETILTDLGTDKRKITSLMRTYNG